MRSSLFSLPIGWRAIVAPALPASAVLPALATAAFAATALSLRTISGWAALLQNLGADPRWQANLSVSLVTEYTEVVHREGRPLGYSRQDCEDFLDYICAAGVERPIYFRWRPVLPDADDDLVLELAVASGAAQIITHNRRHFTAAKPFGIVPLSPAEFLRKLRTLT